MRWLLALLAIVFTASGADPARGALPSGPSPLPNSSFQGGDGDQADAGSLEDWQALQRSARVVHNPDAGQQFDGGSEEGAPSEWGLIPEGPGVSPAQSNLLDAWSSVEQIGGDTFLYLGFTREKSAGTTYLAFELNRDNRLWNNGRAEIPCRRTGDLLVAVAAHGNGIDVTLERWTSTVDDPETSCGARGTLQRVTNVAANAAQGNVNAGAITSYLPGTFPPGTTISASGLFAEAALNLSALLGVGFEDRCFVFGSIWVHSRSSDSVNAALKDYIAPQDLAVRSCAASGTKFLDLNADGVRDDDEPGLPRFLIWADYDGDGVRDSNEPLTQTDSNGNYVLGDIRPTGATYTLREDTLLRRRSSASTAWTCSFPNASTTGGFADAPGGLFGCGWGPFTIATQPYVQGRDFGNWLPGRLTVRKRLFPPTDTGRFDLAVNGEVVKPAAGDRDAATIAVAPGTYDITETPVPPTVGAVYRSSVRCSATVRLRGSSRPGTAYTGLLIRAASQARCTFVNVRPGAPGILIEKTGPTTATAGDTLRYTLTVTNVGDVPVTAVDVSDRGCDGEPERVSGRGDALAPGESWTFQCSRKTDAPGGTCVLSTVTNAASVSGDGAGTPVSDSDQMTTTLRCPPDPVDPNPPEPPVPPPTPVTPVFPSPRPPIPDITLPAGVRPPEAGTAGTASFRVPSRCITRVSEVRLVGRRIAGFSVTVDGRRVSRRTLRILQQRATPLHRRIAPGRHRVSIRVRFRTGSDTAPVTLNRTIEVCGAAPRAPRVTG